MAALSTDPEKLACMNLTVVGGGIVLPDIGSDIDDPEIQHIMGGWVTEALTITQRTGVGFGFGTGLITKGRMR